MSDFDDFVSAGAGEILAQQGLFVTRYVGGNLSAPVTVAGIWIEDPTSRGNDYGDRVERRGTLRLRKHVTTDLPDRWRIRGETWDVEVFGQIEGDFRILKLVRIEKKNTRTTQPNLR